jgi:serine/threonine protein kinase
MLHLHKHNIVRRDLAARNILLVASGDPKISVLFCVSFSSHLIDFKFSLSFMCYFHFIENVKQIEIDNGSKFS